MTAAKIWSNTEPVGLATISPALQQIHPVKQINSIALTILLAAGTAAPSLAAAAHKTSWDGWSISQRNKFLGLIVYDVCPESVKFTNTLVNGMLSKKGTGFVITMLNPDKKVYKTFTPEEFYRRTQAVYGNQKSRGHLNYVSEPRGRFPDKPILGLKTIRIDSVLKLRSPPYVEFPDSIWVSPEITGNPNMTRWLLTLMDLPDQYKETAYPLRLVETMEVRPTRRELYLDTLKVARKKFTANDFKIPSGYKVADDDSDVLEVGGATEF
jgi:hypothetical protein